MVPIAKNFAMHSGSMPPRSNICLLLEAAGADEGAFIVKDLPDGHDELQRREQMYPEVDPRFRNLGAPVVGRAGSILWTWLMRPMGLERSDVAIFNCLSCYPGKSADGNFFYPTGNVRKRAEATCAERWMQPLIDWNPTVSVICMHPSALARDVTPLPVAVRAIEKAKMFAAKGERVLILMGGKAAHHWLNYGSNVTRWTGHWAPDTDWTRARRTERWTENRRLTVVKTVKLRKLTAKTALAFLLSKMSRTIESAHVDDSIGAYRMIDPISQRQFDEMRALTETKKKSKEVAA